MQYPYIRILLLRVNERLLFDQPGMHPAIHAANSCTVAAPGIMIGRPEAMLGFPNKATFEPLLSRSLLKHLDCSTQDSSPKTKISETRKAALAAVAAEQAKQ